MKHVSCYEVLLILAVLWFGQISCNSIKSTQKPKYSPQPKNQTSTSTSGTKQCPCYNCNGVVQNVTCNCRTCKGSPIGIQALEPPKYKKMYLHRVTEDSRFQDFKGESCTSSSKRGDCSCAVIFYSETGIKGCKGFQWYYDQKKKQGVIYRLTETRHTYQQCARTQEYTTRVYDAKLVLVQPPKIPANPQFTPYNKTLASEKLLATDGSIFIFYNCEAKTPSLLVYTNTIIKSSSINKATKSIEALLKTTTLKLEKIKWYIVNQENSCSYPSDDSFKQLANSKSKH